MTKHFFIRKLFKSVILGYIVNSITRRDIERHDRTRMVFGFLSIVVAIFLFSIYHNTDFSGYNFESTRDSIGFASSPLYSGYAVPINGIVVDNNLNFASATDSVQKSIDVTDDIIYRRAYVSYDGSSWSQFNLTPTGTATGEWIYGRGISNIVFSPAILHLNSSRNFSNNTYIIIYSCSKNISIHNWSCHDGWQIIPFNARLNAANSGSVSPVITFISPTPASGSTITTSSQEIAASVSDDSSAVSSWIDFDKSLIGYWSMDYYTATGVYDNSSYKNFGTFNGGLSTSNIVPGVRGKGVSFDGVNYELSVTDTIPKVSNSITISAWVKFNQALATDSWDEAIIIKNDFYGIKRITGSNVIGLYIKNNSDITGNSDVLLGKQSIWTPGQWYHIVVVANSTTGRIYINGVLDNSGPITWDPYSLTSAINIGGNAGYMAETVFNGSLDEVMIFNRALSSSEVSALYNSKTNNFDAAIFGLTNGQHTYTVYAVDGAGNMVNSGQRTLNVNSATCTPSCSGKQCGSDGCSGTCGTCLSKQTCNSNGACVNNVATPTCFDGIQNQGETGVDCGGPCAACSTPALGTYYISTTGVDGAAGSSSAPWKTLAYACSHVTTSGYVIHVNAGTYTETSQCILAPGVSIEGVGTSSIIKSHITNDFAIVLSSGAPGINGAQHISNIKMDGDSLTGYGAIKVTYRNNVDIYGCTFVHFSYYGAGFYGGGSQGVAPTTWSTGNKFHDNTVTDCSGYYPAGDKYNGEGKGAITVDGQDGMLIYNNILDQTSRSAGSNGYLIKGVDGWNKGLKIYNNVITKAPYDGLTWDFAIELWQGRGGTEIYNNTIMGGGIDISGGGGNIKGNYAYSTWIHDNTIGDFVLGASEDTVGIYLETNQEYVIIERNHIKNVARGVYFPTYSDWMTNADTLSNINIRYNIFENIGNTADGNGWAIFIGHQSNGNVVNNFNVYNNVFIGHAGSSNLLGVQIPDIGTVSNVNIKNNIIQGFSQAAIYAGGGSGISINYLSITNNIIYNNGNNNRPLYSSITPANYVYQNNQEGTNPVFASSTDFHLQSNSPAINAGVNVGLTSDYSGNSIIGLPDIGAYEYGGTVTPPSCTISTYTPALNTFCGSKTVVDNCGTSSTKTGTLTCVSPATCGGGGTSNVCGNTVVTPTCFDGIQNQGETGVDCGGPCAACSTPALGTYYISTTGVDGAAGSSSAPWKTLAYACSHVTTSGYVIHVNAGTYTETSQCVLAPGVSIEGVGTTSIIKSVITNTPTIYLYSSSVTNGNQHISNIKMDGNSLTAYEPIVIDKRSNVGVHDCTFVNFYFSGVSFYGENLGDDVSPNNFCLNNMFYNNVITNCASFDIGGSPGNLQIDGQQGMRVYNNVITQTARGARADGFGIKCVQGLNKDLKIYNNTIVIDNDDEAQWDFAMEFWDSLGGIEIYNNRVQGPIDLAGHLGRKGSYLYTYSVHDNILGPDVLKTTSRHGIYLENTNDLSDIYIYNNMLQNLNNPIKIETLSTSKFSNIQIYYNVFYNVGTVGGGWNTNGFCEGGSAGYTLDNLKFYNNVFIAASVAGANPISAIQIPGSGTTTNVEIKNNIITNFNSAISTGKSGGTIKGVTIANNILYNNGATISWAGTVPNPISESNTITSNPSFVNAANGNFHLNSGSPAIGKGISVGLTTDYDGKTVNTPPSIGAYEYP